MLRDWPMALLMSLALLLHIGFSAPTSLYMGNTLVLGEGDIWSVLQDLLPVAAALALGLLVILCFSFRTVVGRFICGVTFCAILGYHFAVFLESGLVVLGAFLTASALLAFLPERALRGTIVFVTMFVILNSAVALVQAFPLLKESVLRAAKQASPNPNPFDRPFVDPPAERFFGTFPPGVPGMNSYSDEENIVVLIIDTLQNDIAEEIIEPEKFDGFTFYRNASSVHPYTGMALPVIASGELYQPGERLADYFQRADAMRVERALIDRGFGVDRLGLWARAAFTYGEQVARARVNGALKATFWDRQLPLPSHLLSKQEAALRWTPVEPGEALTPADHTAMDLDSFSILINQMKVNAAQPRFKWVHFWGAHLPTTLDENCEPVESDYSGKTFVGQAKCMVSQVGRYLEALKAAGIYDKTQIFLISDHGTKEISVNDDTSNDPVPWTARSAAHPMLMFKDFGSRGAMTYNDNAVSLRNMPRRMLGLGSLEIDKTQKRIFMDYKLASEVLEETLSPAVYHIGEDVRRREGWSAAD